MTFAISRKKRVAATIFNVILGAIGAVLPIMPGAALKSDCPSN
ncbi:hypothetical protein ODR38_01490 [Pediococcus acidilactici]